MSSLFARALLAFVAMPGIVAFGVPWLLAPWGAPVSPAGVVPFAAGVVLLLWCVREFYTSGRGTLAPWSPPVSLVVSGPYRWSRNPMYVGVGLILAGWALAFRSVWLGLYAAVIVTLFQIRIVYGEEPWLAKRHGPAWTAYAAGVRRWIGRASPGVRRDDTR